MSKNLNDYSFDELRRCCSVWSMSTLKELSSKIRQTIVSSEKFYSKDPNKYAIWLILRGEFMRKESIVRNEMHKRIKLANYNKKQNHIIQEKITDDIKESPFKIIQI